jgi:Zn-dependent protease with chaperone function
MPSDADILTTVVPFQVIFLLILASTPAALPSGYQFLSPAGAAGLLLGSHLGLLLQVWMRTRQALRALHGSTGATAITASMDRLLQRSRWATLFLLAIALYHSKLPAVVHGWVDGTHVLRFVPLLTETLFVLPTLLTWLGFWTASYYLEGANRERMLPYRLAQGLPAHAMPSLGQFLSMQVRHNFYILVPIGVHNLIIAGGRALGGHVPYAEEVAGPLGIFIVLLLTPWILARVWSTVPLTGPLRSQLDAVAGAYRLRFRNILVWRTHNAVTNAAILGWVPWSRYFLMTDALLETLSDRQLEAVFAHEVGHGVHKHILWYIGAVIGAVGLSYGAAVFWDTYLPPGIARFAGPEVTPGIISMGILLLFMGVGFPWMSHRFEHQADYFASRHMAKAFESDPAVQAGAGVAGGAGGAAVVPATMLPPEIGGPAAGALSMVTTPAEVVTLQQYIAGAYPHAGVGGGSGSNGDSGGGGEGEVGPAPVTAGPMHSAAVPASLGRSSFRSFTPAQAGAELFISALDTILELSHRARNRGGWMHPSPNRRMALLRELAAHPLAANAFRWKMIQTRMAIGLLILAGTIAGAAGMVLESRHAGHAAQPGAPTQSGE